MYVLGSSKTSRSWRFLSPWQDLCDWCPEHPNSGAFHEGELPKETPSQVTTEPGSEDAVWEAGEKGCKFFTQSGRRSGEGGEARYSCFAMYLQFAVILSYFTCTDSLEEVLLAWEGVPVPGIPGVHGQGYTVPSPSEGYD